MSASLRLQGGHDVELLLKGLPNTVSRKVLRQAVNRALTPLNKAAKRQAPTQTKALRRSLGKKVKRFPRGAVWGGVGPRAGFATSDPDQRRMRRPELYAHVVEGGSRTQAPQPFLRRALDATQAEVLSILQTATAQGVEREARRLAARRTPK